MPTDGTIGRPLTCEADFLAFYEDTARGLWSYLHYLCQDRCWTDDLHQESYLRLLQSRPAADDAASLRAYLYRIAGNLFVDQHRRRRLERKWVPASHSDEQFRERSTSGHTQEARRVEARVQCTDLLLRIRGRDRLLLWMAYGEGAPHREIAVRLGLREKTVKVLLFRARRRLASLLGRMRP
jgi:RNA polymerase sigma-70 factor (ECF subfamily)